MTYGNDDEQFRDIAGNWGKLEATVGREAYEADIEMKKAATQTHLKSIEIMEAQKQHGMAQGAVDILMSEAAIRFRDAQKELVQRAAVAVYFMTWLIIAGGAAGVVFLWRWALGYV